MKISELVKTYKLISDPESPDWNVKFLAVAGIAGVVAMGLFATYMVVSETGPFGRALDESEAAPAAQGEIRDEPPSAAEGRDVAAEFVGPGHCDPPALVNDLAAWEAAHPDVTVIERNAVVVNGCTTGFEIIYAT